MPAPKPPQEDARLAALRHYEILDTDPEIGFDDLARLAASICQVPIAAITLIDEDRQWFKSRVGIQSPETPLNQSLCAYAILRPETLVVPDAMLDPTFRDHPAVEGEGGIRFYAGAPLVTPEGFALGTICVSDYVARELSKEQQNALEALARQVGTQLELRRKLRDLRRTTRERDQARAEEAARSEEIERDLRFARQFQQSMLPDNEHYPSVPTAPGTSMRLNFHHIYQPALSLGGDFFDVVKLSESRAGVFIADVMGHGARSALVTAILRTLFQELSLQAHEPGELLTRLDARFHLIMASSEQFLFASACYIILDTERAQAHYSSAGHPAPIHADAQRTHVGPIDDSECKEAALGLACDTEYPSCSLDIEPGDTFLLYTDGLVEAPRRQIEGLGEEFGEDKLCQTIRDSPQVDASRLTQIILEKLNAWTGAATLPDDLCLVAVEAVGEAVPTASGAW